MHKIKGSFGEKSVSLSGGEIDIGDVEDAFSTLQEIDEREGTVSQVFEASRIAGESHLLHSAKLAYEAIEKGKSFADSPGIELTCWVAGLRQINKSLEKVGIDDGTEKAAVIVIGNDLSGVQKAREGIFESFFTARDDSVIDYGEWKRDSLIESYDISKGQEKVSCVEDMVLEKVALLSLET